MENILSTLLGITVILALIGLYAWSTILNRKSNASTSVEACDTLPQGGCCGHVDACSFEAKVKKYDR